MHQGTTWDKSHRIGLTLSYDSNPKGFLDAQKLATQFLSCLSWLEFTHEEGLIR